MYEDIKYESILSRMLDKIPDDIDKREGSIIFDALAPCAIELQLMYIELDNILRETFADTSSREYLILRAKERGLTPYPASHAILQGEFNKAVPIGARFNIDELTYIVIEQITGFTYKVKCENIGLIGNTTFGDMIPIDFIKGLEVARITKLLIPAEGEEETQTFRERYFKSFNNDAFGGNITDYIEKVNSISGVGACKVTPVWNGGGTVKVTIVDSNFNKANDILVKDVQENIDPTKDGSGSGTAPIGHIVTIDTVKEVLINITTSLLFDSGYSFSLVEEQIRDIILEYLEAERRKWANQDSIVIRVAHIESKILDIKGVIDITNTKINGNSNNVTLDQFEVPILFGVSNV